MAQASQLPKPDRDKVHHLFNGLRNGGVNENTSRIELEKEFNKAFAYMAAQEAVNDELASMLEAMEADAVNPNLGVMVEELIESKTGKKGASRDELD